jgi:hypothetical protein
VNDWEPVVGYDGYFVSADGQVKSYRRNRQTGRVMKQSPDSEGYPSVGLYGVTGERRTTKVATIVALAFLGPRPEGLVVRHLDGDKRNSRSDNLAYGSVSDNIQDQILHHGTHRQVKKTHCPKNHLLAGDNLLSRPNRGRECKTYHRERQLVRYHRERERTNG